MATTIEVNTTFAGLSVDSSRSLWLDIVPKTAISFVILGTLVAIAVLVSKSLESMNEKREDSDSDMSDFTRNLLRLKIKLIFGARLFGFGLQKGKKRKFTKDERKAIAIKLARQWRDYVRRVNKERKDELQGGQRKVGGSAGSEGRVSDSGTALTSHGADTAPTTVVHIETPISSTTAASSKAPRGTGRASVAGRPRNSVKHEHTHDGDFIAIELAPADTAHTATATSALVQTSAVFITPVQPIMSTTPQTTVDQTAEKDQISIHSDFSSIVSFDKGPAESVASKRNRDTTYGVRLEDKESFDKTTAADKMFRESGKKMEKYVRPVTASASRPITAGGRPAVGRSGRK